MPWAEAHRAPLLDRVSRGRRTRHRQSGARHRWSIPNSIPGKQPDVCPPGLTAQESVASSISTVNPSSETIRDLVSHHVAVTSTLAVFEVAPPLQPSDSSTRSPRMRCDNYLLGRERLPEQAARRNSAHAHSEGTRIRTCLRQGRRPADGGLRSDRERQRGGGIRRSAQPGVAGRRRLHPGGGDSHRHAERREVSGPGRTTSAPSPRASRPTWWSSMEIRPPGSPMSRK